MYVYAIRITRVVFFCGEAAFTVVSSKAVCLVVCHPDKAIYQLAVYSTKTFLYTFTHTYIGTDNVTNILLLWEARAHIFRP